jgi:hypothetical protein
MMPQDLSANDALALDRFQRLLEGHSACSVCMTPTSECRDRSCCEMCRAVPTHGRLVPRLGPMPRNSRSSTLGSAWKRDPR